MKTIWFYFAGENPMKYFYRNHCNSTSSFCFFSSKEEVLKHFFKHTCEFMPSEIEMANEAWSDEVIENACINKLEKWFAEYLKEEGDPDCFRELSLDVKEFDNCGRAK